jgi:murein DD-endopeptidase MepM/ murein hydrolase activator NlpD
MSPRNRPIFKSGFRYFRRVSSDSLAIRKTNRIYWLFAGIALLVTGIWLSQQPIASIGNPDSFAAQRAKLTSQLSAVLAEEDRLVRESLTLQKHLPESLSTRKIIFLPTRHNRITSTPNRQAIPDDQMTNASPWLPIPANLNSTDAELNLIISSTNRSDTLIPRELLKFDLQYLLIPQPTKPTASQLPAETPAEHWVNINIRSGDSLSTIFKDLNLDPHIAVTIARRSGGKILNKLRTGPYLQVLIRGQQLLSLRYQPDLLSILTVDTRGQEYRINTIKRKFDITQRALTGVIKSSLFQSGVADGVSRDLLYRLSLIFQWQIDFNQDLRPGDRYTLVYEERSLDGRKFSSGPILAAEFVVRGKIYRGIRHVNHNGESHYFTPDGESLEGLFLRSPMPLAPITSRFSNRRYHPVLKQWRAHKGVDYGGSTGDPVMATADGIVTVASRNHQYGKMITLQHDRKYSTLYAHLSRIDKKIRTGVAVKQGQVIGYVGSTGLTTGPHLHYEFRVNGVHKNPLTVDLPRSFAIDRAVRPEFVKTADFWSNRLNQLARR